MAKAAPKPEPANPIAWTLRDEIAMRMGAALVVKGGWGTTQPDGKHRSYSNMREYAEAAYSFADYMLRAREAA
ncbi:MAG TPA: hypothetical protein VGU03_11035 [Frateuria sp.]|uniref:hypothetical protein n=1 Tax=Frateuria sp. TaxID=2211372 RepID=UPI002DE4040D|nr:hypothetical protein [Frateuria sp.]